VIGLILVYLHLPDYREETHALDTGGLTLFGSGSFGVATAGLATVFFVPQNVQSGPPEMIHGIHEALMVLGALTIVSTIVFVSLKRGDGDAMSHPKVFHPRG